MTDVVIEREVIVLEERDEVGVLVEVPAPRVDLVTEARQGPPGPIRDAEGMFLVENRLSELAADPAAQSDAQANLGLGATDPLAYYILAKA